MAKLSKAEAKSHMEACAILAKPGPLTIDETWRVLELWREDAQHVNSMAGAFFTPAGLAHDLSIFVPGKRILDLCAGIGALSFMVSQRLYTEYESMDLVCVEMNPAYIEVGKRILPQSRWICGDVFNLPPDLGRFDCVISNPPFGATPRTGNGPRYTGRSFEYHVIDISADLADYGVFIVPQMSAQWLCSGHRDNRKNTAKGYLDFVKQTGLDLEASAVDTALYREDWHGVSPAVEIVVCDFEEARPKAQAVVLPESTQGEPSGQASLFDFCKPREAA